MKGRNMLLYSLPFGCPLAQAEHSWKAIKVCECVITRRAYGDGNKPLQHTRLEACFDGCIKQGGTVHA
jgi:hypothetical protein